MVAESIKVEFSMNLWSRNMDLSETGHVDLYEQ